MSRFIKVVLLWLIILVRLWLHGWISFRSELDLKYNIYSVSNFSNKWRKEIRPTSRFQRSVCLLCDCQRQKRLVTHSCLEQLTSRGRWVLTGSCGAAGTSGCWWCDEEARSEVNRGRGGEKRSRKLWKQAAGSLVHENSLNLRGQKERWAVRLPEGWKEEARYGAGEEMEVRRRWSIKGWRA